MHLKDTTPEQRMLQAYPALSAFFEKYALGPKERPSCFVCGRTVEQWPPAIQHAELPGIVACFPCRDAARLSREDSGA
jgi:hypothetical protein